MRAGGLCMAENGSKEPVRYHFSDLTLDTGQRLVSRGEDTLEVSGLTFDLLQAIVEAAPNIVSADDLAEKVWSGRPVSPETITQRAMMLRQALGDHAESPVYFEVIRGHGFRLIPDVVPGKIGHKRISRRAGTGLVAGLAILAVAVIGLFQFISGNQQNILPNSVAVLPFANLSPDPDNGYFAAGVHEAILNELATIRDVNVIARTTMLRYAGTDTPISQIAQELNVETVMEGSVQYLGDRVRITAQLIDPQSGAHLWSQNYDRAFADIFAVQTEIATRITIALEAELTPIEHERINSRPTNSPAAYALYLNALDAFDIDYSDHSNVVGLMNLDRALELDPEFALAYATRAIVRIWSQVDVNVDLTMTEWTERVRSDADRALQLDPTSSLAYTALARLHSLLWNRAEAEEAYERALELTPNDSSLLSQYSRFKSFTRQNEDALRLARRALVLNPRSLAVGQVGDTYFLVGDLDAAATAYSEFLELNPASFVTYQRLGEVEASRGNDEAALAHLRLWEESIEPGYIHPGRGPRGAFAYAVIGRHTDAMRLAAKTLDDYPSLGLSRQALAHLALGNRDEALRLLRAAADSRDSVGDTLIYFIKFNVWRSPILEELEFVEVRGRLGFQE
jgi:TolB-like protein/DNA-binding winged helix-turn-helix (wHTH) protein/tetratricopeptide (TPR) repeat protein